MSYKQENAEMQVYFNKSFFFVGEFIVGNIEINIKSNTLIYGITIEIFLTENWKIKDGENANSENIVKKIVVYNIDLKRINCLKKVDNNNFLLTSGISFIPFNFRFSEENIPSFEYPLPNKRAFARYTFRVNINSSYLSGSRSYFLGLISRPIINDELSKSIKQGIKKWKLFDKGETILKISLKENNYKYDSNCTVNIDIDNTKGKTDTKEYKIKLYRKIKLKNKNGDVKFEDETLIINEVVKAVVPTGKKDIFEYNFNFKEKDTEKKFNYTNEINPYNADMTKINFFMPSINGQIISCEYEIKVTLYFSCFVDYNHRPRLAIPVYLVHQLPIDYQLEIQEQIDFENALKISQIKDEEENIDKYFNDNQQFKNKTYDNNKINNYNNNNNNYKMNEEEYDDELPSLEVIEEARKDKINVNENKIENDNNNNNININEIVNNNNNMNDNMYGKMNDNMNDNMNDSNPPPNCLYESAPLPFQINDNNNNNNINNNENNVIDINRISEGPEDFSVLNNINSL